jgi:hypothetical protein
VCCMSCLYICLLGDKFEILQMSHWVVHALKEVEKIVSDNVVCYHPFSVALLYDHLSDH